MSKVFPTLADWAATAFAAPDDALWRLQEDGYQAALEHQVETRFAISNGFLGVRGSLEQPMVGSRPRTFIAGRFDTAPGEVPLPKLVAGPDWLRFQLLVAGEPLALEASQTLTHGRTIDMWRGVLRAEWRQRDPAGRVVRLRTLRFVSLANRALAVQVVWIAVVQPTPLALEAWIEPPPGELYLTRTEPDVQVWRTAYPAKQLAVASTMTLRLDAQKIRPVSGDVGRSIWRWNATPDQPAIVATGSPFPDVRFDGRVFNNSQCNNVLIFPGVGLGILAAGARRVTDAMFVAAAHALSEARQAGADMLADAAPAPAPTRRQTLWRRKQHCWLRLRHPAHYLPVEYHGHHTWNATSSSCGPSASSAMIRSSDCTRQEAVATLVKLVVDLPADDLWVIRKVFGDMRYDSPGVVVVDRVIRAIFAPVAERECYAVLAHAKDR